MYKLELDCISLLNRQWYRVAMAASFFPPLLNYICQNLSKFLDSKTLIPGCPNNNLSSALLINITVPGINIAIFIIGCPRL